MTVGWIEGVLLLIAVAALANWCYWSGVTRGYDDWQRKHYAAYLKRERWHLTYSDWCRKYGDEPT